MVEWSMGASCLAWPQLRHTIFQLIRCDRCDPCWILHSACRACQACWLLTLPVACCQLPVGLVVATTRRTVTGGPCLARKVQFNVSKIYRWPPCGMRYVPNLGKRQKRRSKKTEIKIKQKLWMQIKIIGNMLWVPPRPYNSLSLTPRVHNKASLDHLNDGATLGRPTWGASVCILNYLWRRKTN